MKIAVIGMGPWPLEKDVVVTGPSIRLRQFIEPLILARHDIVAVLLEEKGRDKVRIDGVLEAKAFPPEEIDKPEILRERLDLHFCGAVMGVGSLMPAAAACRLATALEASCWIDYFGDPLAELHASMLRQGGKPDTMARDHVWKYVRETLMRGDCFSTVSGPQRHALLGQLGLLGRYGNYWDVCRRIHEIPCAVPLAWTEIKPRPAFPAVLAERGLTEKSSYVYFGGSWNVWLDETTMARALAKALGENSKLTFVSAGIPTGPAGEMIRQALMQGLASFQESGRVIELSPQSGAAEDALLSYAGACISLDRPIPEAELGSRNRLLAMVRWGARPIVSLEAGVETLLVAAGLASGIDNADSDRAAREIQVACARSTDRREEDRRAGLEWLESVTFRGTLEPVVAWLADGAPRWPESPCDGLLDRWASFPPDPEKLFGDDGQKKKNWFFF